ncbi:MAG TPA: hypothetical protein QF700_05070 [Prochlorococcus sp.]|nr:hypothetical protein [Prochlorococcus sp.]
MLLLLLVVNSEPALADGAQEEFTNHMLEWREKSELAQDNLREAEDELKAGSKYKACIKQRIASKYGVEAFEALINAQQINDSDNEFDNLEENLARWNNLRDCNADGSLLN